MKGKKIILSVSLTGAIILGLSVAATAKEVLPWKDFEKAIALDPNYTKAFINLACVFDILGNPEAAIGKIKELPKDQQNTTEAKRILAIAYFHADNEKKSEEIWNEIEYWDLWNLKN